MLLHTRQSPEQVKTFKDWPEMVENIIPYIGGEEEKSEQEPLRIWGKVEDGQIVKASETGDHLPVYPCTCTERTYRSCICKIQKETYQRTADRKTGELQRTSHRKLELPSAPKQFIQYLEEDNRPQVKMDVNFENGMGISVGRLREDTVYDWKFVGLSHNTVRGAAGGAVLCAETLKAKGYIQAK